VEVLSNESERKKEGSSVGHQSNDDKFFRKKKGLFRTKDQILSNNEREKRKKSDDDSEWNPKPRSHNLILNAYSYNLFFFPLSFIISVVRNSYNGERNS